MTRVELRSAIFNWIKDSLALAEIAIDDTNIVRGQQDAPSPTTRYVSYIIASNSQPRTASNTRISSEEEEVVSGDKEFIIYVQAYGSGADDCISALEDSKSFFNIRKANKERGIALISFLGGVNSSELMTSDFEERAAGDFLFRTGFIRYAASEIIETVEVTGKVIRTGGEQSSTFDISKYD